MAAPIGKVDRQTTTPFLLRLFYKLGSFYRLDDFSPDTRLPSHLQIYTWPDCTIRELTTLLVAGLNAIDPSLLPSPYAGTRIAFRMVFADMQSSRPGRYTGRELGSVVIGAMDDDSDTATSAEMLKNMDGEPNKTLGDGRFVIGDFISCAVLPPAADGSVQPAPAALV
ncbi:Sin3 associated polypeptide p18 [Clohesyomyces aquaticus]|uniref:Sin3 associated polypeptide p18 n=1 Tax=Clohesyomyces aquaticus TaxID=1231657 RepID=A0A1Y2A1S7_9PLEO|nr:Sin3 associated polypeptide p18 [Clohesyomyces aquaticus]